MNKQTEALKMAIEAMEDASSNSTYWEADMSEKEFLKRIQACKEALAQPQPKLFLDLSNSNGNHPVQQEPVAWNEEEFNAIAYAYRTCPAHEIKMVSDRYQELVNYVLSITHPAPSWQGLSDDEIEEIIVGKNGTYFNFARAIEQALKEKNHGQ